MTDHQEQYHNDISSSTAKVDFSDLLDFTTEAVNSKFRIHRLKLNGSSVLEPFNYLILVREKNYFFCERVIERNVEFETWDEHGCQAGKAYGR